MRTTWYLWALYITAYILNIVLIAVTGADLVNNIVAWTCCIILTISLILKDKLNERHEKLATEQFANYRKMRIVYTFLTLHKIKEKLQGNEEAIKIIDEEIERLEKEL